MILMNRKLYQNIEKKFLNENLYDFETVLVE